jgi:hypothetical protein
MTLQLGRSTAILLGSMFMLGGCLRASAGSNSESTVLVHAPRMEGTTDAPVLVMGHHPWRGIDTVIGIHRADESYRLVVERHLGDSCIDRRVRVVLEREAARLEGLMKLLAPERAAEKDECSRSRRDGASWFVGARVDGRPLWRTRQVQGRNDPACVEFERACSEAMLMVGLACAAHGCTTEQEDTDRRLSWCP